MQVQHTQYSFNLINWSIMESWEW